MKAAPRTIPILLTTLLFLSPGGLAAQDEASAAGAPGGAEAEATAQEAPPAGAEARPTSYEVRNQLTSLLLNQPRELATILVLDPSLLSNREFLEGYPELARFVAEHAEVRRNPQLYLADFWSRRAGGGTGDDILEVLVIFATIFTIAMALAWLLRTLIEQKRWSRLSRMQAEVHNKILDRFGSSEELLEYVRTPAGERFLESAPIPLHAAERPTQSPPVTRALWSIQIGVVAAAAALGALLVSGRLDEEGSRALFALGMIGFSVGVGFIAAAAVSLFLSRRLGLWESRPGPGLDDPDAVR